MTSAIGMAADVRAGRVTARALADEALARIRAHNPRLNAFTTILAERALADADAVDRAVAAGRDPGPLAGVPFAVKNLYDIEGVTTIAGSRILRDAPPAGCDATAVARLRAAGAVLVGALNMDEFAYGFVTENFHDGPTRNPHAPDRIAGGSSGGSAAAVAAGLVPITMGSDTNGSIRVPAALCGVWGLKPTFGRLSRAGTFPFVPDLDHVGPFARSVADLAAAYDVLQGRDAADPACTDRPVEAALPGLEAAIRAPRVGILRGWFAQGASRDALEAVERVAASFASVRDVVLPGAAAARSAAFCLTAAQGGELHRERLAARPFDFDPATRDRLFAGLLLPAATLSAVRRVRRRFQDEMAAAFAGFDVLLAPSTPFPATPIGQATCVIDGVEVPVRANLGLYTQPISFVGLPVVAAPVLAAPALGAGPLPLGVQIIGRPWDEAGILRVAAWLERAGVCGAWSSGGSEGAC